MAFKVSSTTVVDNSARVPGGVIPDKPSTMPTSVSIASGPGNYNPYAVARVTGAPSTPTGYAAAYRTYISGNILVLY